MCFFFCPTRPFFSRPVLFSPDPSFFLLTRPFFPQPVLLGTKPRVFPTRPFTAPSGVFLADPSFHTQAKPRVPPIPSLFAEETLRVCPDPSFLLRQNRGFFCSAHTRGFFPTRSFPLRNLPWVFLCRPPAPAPSAGFHDPSFSVCLHVLFVFVG